MKKLTQTQMNYNKSIKEENMAEQFVASAPAYVGNGIAIWKATDKNGNTYLKVKVLEGKAINCFKYTPKAIKQIKADLD